jgi:hypothetical protein
MILYLEKSLYTFSYFYIKILFGGVRLVIVLQQRAGFKRLASLAGGSPLKLKHFSTFFYKALLQTKRTKKMDYYCVKDTDHYATDVERLQQLCDYIGYEYHWNTVYCETNRRLQTDERIDMTTILNECREIIKRKYPLISASIYEFDKAVNELSNVVSQIEHQQEMPLRDIFRTIYIAYNNYINQGWERADAFLLFREQHLEMYGQLKMLCRKLRKEPRGLIEGVGDIVYI